MWGVKREVEVYADRHILVDTEDRVYCRIKKCFDILYFRFQKKNLNLGPPEL